MSEWISVEDKLPSFYEKVLIFSPGKYDNKKYRQIGYLNKSDLSFHAQGFVSKVYPTHWAPLLQPPEIK